MRYQWRGEERHPVSPQLAGEALESIRANGGGFLTPAAVVKASRPAKAPLHQCFEWDNNKAAGMYREEQARRLIRSIAVLPDEASPATAGRLAFIHVVHPEKGSCYMETEAVVSNEDLYRQALDEAVSLLSGLKRRFAHLTELKQVFRAIDRLRDTLGQDAKAGE